MADTRFVHGSASAPVRVETGTMPTRGRSGRASRSRRYWRRAPAQTAMTTSLTVVPAACLMALMSSSGTERTATRRCGVMAALNGVGGAAASGGGGGASAVAPPPGRHPGPDRVGDGPGQVGQAGEPPVPGQLPEGPQGPDLQPHELLGLAHHAPQGPGEDLGRARHLLRRRKLPIRPGPRRRPGS